CRIAHSFVALQQYIYLRRKLDVGFGTRICWVTATRRPLSAHAPTTRPRDDQRQSHISAWRLFVAAAGSAGNFFTVCTARTSRPLNIVAKFPGRHDVFST